MTASTCTVKGCGRPHLANGFCEAHDRRARRGSTNLKPIRPAQLATMEATLACIKGFVKERGFPPSVAELGDCLGLKSKSTTSAWLAKLVEAGWIEREPGKPRALRVMR